MGEGGLLEKLYDYDDTHDCFGLLISCVWRAAGLYVLCSIYLWIHLLGVIGGSGGEWD